MAEHPLISNQRTVQAILAGRQTQDRRPIKPQPREIAWIDGQATAVWRGCIFIPREGDWRSHLLLRCPYGVVGDHLWVRETWGFTAEWPMGFQKAHIEEGGPWLSDDMAYRADNPLGRWCWRPSIHMPRWASRIVLEVTDVRVQQVQEISEQDAYAEGIDLSPRMPHPRLWFRDLWDELYAKKGLGWDVNPWVWASTFRRVTP